MITGRPKPIREVYCEQVTCTRCNIPYMHRLLEDQTHVNAVCPRCGCSNSIIQTIWKGGTELVVKGNEHYG
jgi:hypothetical protein